MVQLQKDSEKLKAAKIQVAAISYDSVKVLKNFSDKNEIGFPLLADEGSKMIKAFGIFKADEKEGSRTYGIPYPGTFIVDKEGVIRAKLFHEAYQYRHTTDALLEAVQEIEKK